MIIRKSTSDDLNTVLDIERRAFGNDKEAELVSDLLHDLSAVPRLSLLASINGGCVGHILFTAVNVTGVENTVTAPQNDLRGCFVTPSQCPLWVISRHMRPF